MRSLIVFFALLLSLTLLCAVTPQPMFGKIKTKSKDKGKGKASVIEPSPNHEEWLRDILAQNQEIIANSRRTYYAVGNLKLDALLAARNLASKGHPVSPTLQDLPYLAKGPYVHPEEYFRANDCLQRWRDTITKEITTLKENQDHFRECGYQNQVDDNERVCNDLEHLLRWIDSNPCDLDIEEQLENLKEKILKDKERNANDCRRYDSQYSSVKQVLMTKGIEIDKKHSDFVVNPEEGKRLREQWDTLGEF